MLKKYLFILILLMLIVYKIPFTLLSLSLYIKTSVFVFFCPKILLEINKYILRMKFFAYNNIEQLEISLNI